jgi:hypothetical protein
VIFDLPDLPLRPRRELRKPEIRALLAARTVLFYLLPLPPPSFGGAIKELSLKSIPNLEFCA